MDIFKNLGLHISEKHKKQRRRCFFHVQVLHAAALNIGESENATVPLSCDGWKGVVFSVLSTS